MVEQLRGSRAGARGARARGASVALEGASSARPMSEADLTEVLVIEHEAYAWPWSEGIFRDCLRVGYCCWVLEHEGRVEAYGIMQAAVGESHILNLCVRPSSQGRGFGGQLLAHLLAVARTHHSHVALLEVRPSNLAARRLYRRVGFSEVGVRRGYYPGHGGREDALVLALELG